MNGLLYGIWGGVAIVAGVLAAIGALLVWAIGPVGALSVAFFVICALMILVILAQKPRGGGLAGAFGGAGGASTQTAFGAKTGDVMTWATIVLFVLFVATAMGLTWTTLPESEVTVDPALLQQVDPASNSTGASVPAEQALPSVPSETAPVPASTESQP